MSYIRNEENHKYLKREARKVANELNKVSVAQKEQLMNNWSKIIELIKKHGYEEFVDAVIKSDKCWFDAPIKRRKNLRRFIIGFML